MSDGILHALQPVTPFNYSLRPRPVIRNLLHGPVGVDHARATRNTTLMVDRQIAGYFVEIGPDVLLSAYFGLFRDPKENVLNEIRCKQPVVKPSGEISLQFIGIAVEEGCDTVGQGISGPLENGPTQCTRCD